MDDPTTVLVVTPSLGGHYFGQLLAGVTRQVSQAGGRVVVVETLPESAPRDEAGEPGDFSIPVAWSHVHGVVSITTAAGADYLRRVRETGRPVVLSSTLMPDFQAPAAMPDNHGGVVAGVEHLVGHGHTRIGFVGNFAQQDIRDRFEAYRQALTANGLDLDPALVVRAPNNGETGGDEAARLLLAADARPTALMVATDRNALGLMRRLTAAGMVLPDELAIIGFDNIEAGAFSVPALSTVDQRFDEVGALAATLVLAAIGGEQVPSDVFTPPVGALTLRTSCGCSAEPRPRGAAPAEPSAGPAPRVRLERSLTAVLLGDESRIAPVRTAVRAAVGAVERMLTATEPATEAEVDVLVLLVRSLTSRPDALRRVIEAVSRYASDVVVSPLQASAWATVATALWRLQASALLRQVEETEDAMAEQYVVDAALLDTTQTDPRTLGWLADTHVRAAVLALRAEERSDRVLDVVGAYDAGGTLAHHVGTRTVVESFPPTELLDLLHDDREICVVVPVRTTTHDWGLLALVGAVDSASTRETYQHWAGLLCTALESRRLQEEVRRSSLHDALSGLPNRRLFLERLTAAIDRRERTGTPFAVLFLDLDGFKLINDALGHQAGDRVLAAVGDRIRRELRSVDTGARFGGDEFAVLLHDTDPEGALRVAHRVQAVLAEQLDLDGADVAVRASIGIATGSVGQESAEDVLRDADAAMYRAKSREPGAVAFFDDAMRAHVVRHQHLHADVRRALAEHQFEVFYQPIVNLASHRTDRFEALVRWHHPERGVVLPDEFLPVMEETGLIVQLGHWELEEVCRQLAEWGPDVVNVAVNLSDRQFWHRGLLPRVLDALSRNGLTPDRLTLEVTEGVLMRRPEVALHLMQELHDSGLRLHIDDFGTGYSSLETLHRFPVDAFKIDRSFIRGLASGDRSTELITALVDLGRSLGVAVVAEGVETDDQLELLQRIGCLTGQGYLFMPAVTGEQAGALLGRDLAEQPHAEPPHADQPQP